MQPDVKRLFHQQRGDQGTIVCGIVLNATTVIDVGDVGFDR
jgi:hypothetical protein